MIDFFIIGSARSGTTLLRTLLAGHSAIAVAPETYFTIPLLRRADDLTPADAWRVMYSSGSFDEWPLSVDDLEPAWQACRPSTVPEAVGAFFQAYREWAGKEIIGDKTPYHCQHVDLLAQAFPHARFVVLERDGRAVARSAQRTHFGSGSFLVNAQRWSRDVVAVDRSRRRHPNRFVTIRYEDLTQDPQPVLSEVCAFLDVDFEAAMLDTEVTGREVLHGMRYPSHLTRVAAPIGPPAKVRLPARLERSFQSVAGPGLTVLGESLPPLSPMSKTVGLAVTTTEAARRRWWTATSRAGALVGRRPIDRYNRTPTADTRVTQPDSVAALVLTHGAPDALARCLAAIAGQSHKPGAVIVLDNHGHPPAVVAANRRDVQVLRSSANTGPAGGWADLISIGAASGAGWLWLLDDDCIPDPDTLRSLRRFASASGARAVMPTIFEERTSSRRHYPAWIGPLLDASILDRVGLPREEIVWWAEDSEYLQVRLAECGFPLTYCDEAVVGHSMARRGGSPAIWRLYYETRNSIWLRVRVRQQYDSPRHMWRLLRAVASTSRSAVRHPHRGTAARAVLAGVIHGMVDPGRQAPGFVVADDGPRLAPDHSVTPAVDA